MTQSRSIRSAFTLVELLVVITLIAVISGMLSVALTSAQQEAKIRRCRGELLNYGQLVQARYGGVAFQTRQLFTNDVRGSNGVATTLGGSSETPPTPARRRQIQQEDLARKSLLARRDLARMSLPECRMDLYMPPVFLQRREAPIGQTASSLTMRPVAGRVPPPPSYDRMRKLANLLPSARVEELHAGSMTDVVQPTTVPPTVYDPLPTFIAQSRAANRDAPSQRSNLFNTCRLPERNLDAIATDDLPLWSAEHESAECLYLILATLELNGQTAIDQVPQRNIGDTDGDGMQEILDPWGVPVLFLRQPIGLADPVVPNWRPPRAGTQSEYPTDPDPFDFLLSDFRFNDVYTDNTTRPLDPVTGMPVSYDTVETAFHPTYVPPMIISAGSDGEFGLYTHERMGQLHPQRQFSSSMVELTTAPGPPISDGASGTLAYRFPDTAFNFKAFSDATVTPDATISSGFTGIVYAKRGGGLGGVISDDDYVPLADAVEAAADNILSIQSSL